MSSAIELSRERWWRLVDEVLDRAIDGDINRLLEFVGDQCNACDYVDDELIARWNAAKKAVTERGAA